MMSRIWFVGIALSLGFFACSPAYVPGGPVPSNPYGDGAVVTIDEDGATVTTSTTCVAGEPNCPIPSHDGKHCDGNKTGPVDVVTQDGKVLTVVCYPGTTKDWKEAQGTGSVTGNKVVVTFGDGKEATTEKGDLVTEGNNIVVYGNGPDKTVIEGEGIFKGNNSRVRGVTIQKNATFEGNNISLVGAIIEGDLIVKGNNALLADVWVMGDLVLEGNNHILLRVHVSGKADLKGSGYQCGATYQVTDADQDGSLTADEIGAQISCP